MRYGDPSSWKNQWCEQTTEGGEVSVWWSDLGRLEGGETQNVGWLSNGISSVLGCGKSISFWNEKWVGTDALSNTFRRLNNISLMKEAKVEQMGMWRDGKWCWKFNWRRRLFVWEEELLANMMDILNLKTVKADVEDGWSWLGSCSQIYK